ncbi:hypothetical protein NEOLEDRAFT_1048381, partial [Neolentinus lepideus HHB14362 ss-1]
WDGNPDYDRFEHWIYDIENYFTTTGIPKNLQVRMIGRWLRGKAADYFMNSIADNPDEFSKENVYHGLFAYCFPVRFKAELRKRYNKCFQDNRPFREFLRELQKLSKRLPDISGAHLVLKVWENARRDLRVEWSKLGLDPETATLAEL